MSIQTLFRKQLLFYRFYSNGLNHCLAAQTLLVMTILSWTQIIPIRLSLLCRLLHKLLKVNRRMMGGKLVLKSFFMGLQIEIVSRNPSI
jgi:hypothetical protein